MAYDRNTGAQINDDLINIKQQIHEVLQTPKGTRLKNRSYGSDLHTLVDEPNVNQLVLDFIRMSYEAITKQIPGIKVTAVKPIFKGSQVELQVTFDVGYKLISRVNVYV